jgi:hypothetical protein
LNAVQTSGWILMACELLKVVLAAAAVPAVWRLVDRRV